MTENVEKFFAIYSADAALRRRLAEAEAAYPGCLEIREDVVRDVLLPVAEELGLPFTVKELRAYETRIKLERNMRDEITDEDEDFEGFWLVDRGWAYDENLITKAEKKFEERNDL
ncbi:MAG: hypothetical protein IJV41_04120 [Oscillospiraceae bacterium]|nr:hypothetical protein [Oscillospiraceae bacterium]